MVCRAFGVSPVMFIQAIVVAHAVREVPLHVQPGGLHFPVPGEVGTRLSVQILPGHHVFDNLDLGVGVLLEEIDNRIGRDEIDPIGRDDGVGAIWYDLRKRNNVRFREADLRTTSTRPLSQATR